MLEIEIIKIYFHCKIKLSMNPKSKSVAHSDFRNNQEQGFFPIFENQLSRRRAFSLVFLVIYAFVFPAVQLKECLLPPHLLIALAPPLQTGPAFPGAAPAAARSTGSSCGSGATPPTTARPPHLPTRPAPSRTPGGARPRASSARSPPSSFAGWYQEFQEKKEL